MMTGVRATDSTSAARRTSSIDATGAVVWTYSRTNGSHGDASTSIGIARCTGRGRDEPNTFHARSIICGRCDGSVMVSLNAHTLRTRPAWSGRSCSGPTCAPSASVGVVDASTRSGRESWYAWAIGVRAFVSPGPLINTHTPGRPVTRPQPSAMNPAPCSWRGDTARTPLRWSPRYSSTLCTPGMPKTTSTPYSRARRSISASPTFIEVTVWMRARLQVCGSWRTRHESPVHRRSGRCECVRHRPRRSSRPASRRRSAHPAVATRTARQ